MKKKQQTRSEAEARQVISDLSGFVDEYRKKPARLKTYNPWVLDKRFDKMNREYWDIEDTNGGMCVIVAQSMRDEFEARMVAKTPAMFNIIAGILDDTDASDWMYKNKPELLAQIIETLKSIFSRRD